MIDISNVVEFCRKELNIGEENNILVFLEDLTEDGVKGWCSDDLVEVDGEIEYEIDIEETLSDEEMLVTLCHEMVHVKQYSEGRIADEDEAYDLENVLVEKYRSLLAV